MYTQKLEQYFLCIMKIHTRQMVLLYIQYILKGNSTNTSQSLSKPTFTKSQQPRYRFLYGVFNSIDIFRSGCCAHGNQCTKLHVQLPRGKHVSPFPSKKHPPSLDVVKVHEICSLVGLEVILLVDLHRHVEMGLVPLLSSLLLQSSGGERERERCGRRRRVE